MIRYFGQVPARPERFPRRPAQSWPEGKEQIRREWNRLRAAFNQLKREIAPRPASLGTSSDDWATVRNARNEATRLRSLWRPWMGTDPVMPWGTVPYSDRSHPSSGQLEARTNWYNDKARRYRIIYNGLFKDWGLTFESLTNTEQAYYVDEIAVRIQQAENPTDAPLVTAANPEGVNRTHATNISDPTIDAAATNKYADVSETGTGETMDNIIKYLPAVGVGLTAFKLFFNK